ncbi:hypothetical protein TNCV_2592521 [Trichonephila clavipes]|nr:hypothetical protein TNCV_2592521 [Trichonephila clavipes]
MRLSVQLEKREELTTTVLVMSSSSLPLSMSLASSQSIAPVGSTASLSEHVKLLYPGKVSNQHQVSRET